jgi:formate hydrogenlyase subunit 4
MLAALFALIAQLLHVGLMLAAAPLLTGAIRHMRARLVGRAGPSMMQPWRDLHRLARKQPVVAETASPLFTAAPAVDFAATLVAAALVPSFALGMTTAPVADLLVLAGLLALARTVLALAAMDAGTAFGGIGASRAMTIAAIAEPALLLVIFTLALVAGTTNLDAVARLSNHAAHGLHAALGLALVAAVMVALAATLRGPVDARDRADAGMIGPSMLLEYSGRHLALIEWAASLRLLTLLSLIVAAFAPFGAASAGGTPLVWPLGLLAWGGKVLVLAVSVSVAETVVTPLAPRRVPRFLSVAIVLGLLAVIVLCAGQGFA